MDEQPGVKNPFATSQCDASSSAQTRVRLVDWIACLVMFPWLASNYMCWAIAYLKLGRAPVPGVDLVQETDSTIMRVSWFISDFFTAYGFFVVFSLMLLQLLIPGIRFLSRMKRCVLAFVMMLLFIIFASIEPLGAWYWIIQSS